MRNIVFTICLICLTANLFGYYNPEQGRWTSRDPIEEKGGLNLYSFCKNEATNKWDNVGLEWSNLIRKSNMRYATVCKGNENDSVEILAELLNLSAVDAFGDDGWLRRSDETPVTESMFPTINNFKVPNTIYIDLGSEHYPIIEIFLFAAAHRMASANVTHQKNKGYHSVYTQDVTSSQVVKHLKTNGIYSYFYYGHAARNSSLTPQKNDVVFAGRYTPYKIPMMYLHACWSASLDHGAYFDDNISGSYGVPVWNLNTTVGIYGFTDKIYFHEIVFQNRTPDFYEGSLNLVNGAYDRR